MTPSTPQPYLGQAVKLTPGRRYRFSKTIGVSPLCRFAAPGMMKIERPFGSSW